MLSVSTTVRVLQPAGESTADLLQAAREALAACGGRVATFSFANEVFVAKAPGSPRGTAQAFLLKMFCRFALGQSLPMATLRLAGGARRLADEAARLAALAASGEAVPQVVAFAADCMVLRHVGETLEHGMRSMSPTETTVALDAAIDDLARFHRAGHWHGGAQVKNMTRSAGLLYRIDFEEDIGAYLPLPIVQAYDLILLVNSVTLLHGMDEMASTELATHLLTRYFDRHPAGGEIRAVLRRAQPALAAVCRLLAPWRHRRGRSLKRIYVLRDALHESIGRH